MEEEAASGGAESGEKREEEEARLRSAAAILSPRSEPEPEPLAPPPPPPPPPRPPPAASPGLAEQATGRPGGRGRSRAPSGSSSRSLRPRSGPHQYAQRLGRASASCWRPGEACRRGEGVVGWGGGTSQGTPLRPARRTPQAQLPVLKGERSSRLRIGRPCLQGWHFVAFVQDQKTFEGKLSEIDAAGLEELRLKHSGKVNSAHNLSTKALWLGSRQFG